MANFTFVVSDPGTRKSYQSVVEQDKATGIVGKKLKEEVSGDFLGLDGYTLMITGGSDKDGFPMHPSLQGSGRRKTLLTGPPGFHPKFNGQRRRKTVRGNTVSQDIVQINVKVTKKGEKPLEEVFPTKAKESANTETPSPK